MIYIILALLIGGTWIGCRFVDRNAKVQAEADARNAHAKAEEARKHQQSRKQQEQAHRPYNRATMSPLARRRRMRDLHPDRMGREQTKAERDEYTHLANST
jgi:hypothetical protein